jgi:hypothetical protein
MSRFVGWATGNPIGFLTVTGLAAYGVVRLASWLFYRPLNVTPEEVGIGYQEALAQPALALLLGLVVFSILVVGFLLVAEAWALTQLTVLRVTVLLWGVVVWSLLGRRLGFAFASMNELVGALQVSRLSATGWTRRAQAFSLWVLGQLGDRLRDHSALGGGLRTGARCASR